MTCDTSARGKPRSAATWSVKLGSSVTPKNARTTGPMLDQLPGDAHRHVDWNRETDAFAAAGAGGDGGVHADHFAVQVQQRSAAVARIDGGIGLQKVLKLNLFVAELEIAAAFGADDAERDRVAQSKRAADGQHEIADIDLYRYLRFSRRTDSTRKWPARPRQCPGRSTLWSVLAADHRTI